VFEAVVVEDYLVEIGDNSADVIDYYLVAAVNDYYLIVD
jgi:hypothetical protein